MKSAFGVDHPESISKAGIGFKPKFGNIGSIPKVMGRSFKANRAKGLGRMDSGINAMASGIRHSPGTAIGAGLGITGAAAGTGYLANRN